MRGLPVVFGDAVGAKANTSVVKSWHLVVLICLFGAAVCSGDPPEMTVEPDFFYLGSFSTLDPLDSEMIAGSTTLRILSAEDWQLELQLEGPIRRVSDGLELPMSRVLETNPEVPHEIVNLQPYIYNTEQGSGDWREYVADWLDVGTGLQEYLDMGDPPGTYEVTLMGRLLDAQGVPMTEHVSATMQFDVQPWVEFVDATLPSPAISIEGGEAQGESDVVQVAIVSNTSWTLRVQGTGDLVNESGGVLPLTGLSICVEEITGRGIGERPLRSGCEMAQLEPVALYVGEEPAPFTVGESEIPVFLRYEGEPPIPSGAYSTSLGFEVAVGTSSP